MGVSGASTFAEPGGASPSSAILDFSLAMKGEDGKVCDAAKGYLHEKWVVVVSWLVPSISKSEVWW